MDTADSNQQPWFIKSNVPVDFPPHAAFDIAVSQTDFEKIVRTEIIQHVNHGHDEATTAAAGAADKDNGASPLSPSSIELGTVLQRLDLDSTMTEPAAGDDEDLRHPVSLAKNQMLTENAGVAYRSTRQPLLDLFFELEDVVSGTRLLELLDASWNEDPLMTLKVILNSRSIHLGKASRPTFYRCAGWLAQNHPLTLITNLRWLSRPIVEKKLEKKDDEDDEDMVVLDLEPEKDEDDNTCFDVKNGVSHGYWKDLLNTLALCVNGKLDALVDPGTILNVKRDSRLSKSERHLDQEQAKTKRHQVRNTQHDQAVEAFKSNPVYRCLHLTVARLFTDQLKTDLILLHGQDAKAKKNISLCAKWAPSHDRFHDRHTFIVSSIAELLHSITEVTGGSSDMDRELYLRHARELYRKDISALRAHIEIVEHNLSSKTIGKIKYERVPSVAMSNYSKIFANKDTERFEKYITDVAEGKSQISGATLLPSTLIKKIMGNSVSPASGRSGVKRPKVSTGYKIKELEAKVIDNQWKTLVQRIRDSGTLESSIAVCDVSGSMLSPIFQDGTRPMDSSIGLSLLLAEVTAPPFGGRFITFSSVPTMQSFDVTLPLQDKFRLLSQAEWGQSTNFAAVFEDLILPMAVKHKLKQEDMVKRVFVFSDMQFDSAETGGYYSDNVSAWSTSFERIKAKFSAAGYDLPQLVFWNLAGGRAGYTGSGDITAPKPVTAEENGTALVSGYSQGMLKVFLDNGSFGNGEEEEEVQTTEDSDTVVLESPAKRQKQDPMAVLKKAIGHKGYRPLKVVD